MSMMVKCTKSMQTSSVVNTTSLSMNFDGAPKFKSSTMQLWPIQFIINELPPPSKRYGNIFTQSCIIIVCNSRFSRKNLLLTALWCSTKKAPPVTVTVLEPVMNEISLLETEGWHAVFCESKIIIITIHTCRCNTVGSDFRGDHLQSKIALLCC